MRNTLTKNHNQMLYRAAGISDIVSTSKLVFAHLKIVAKLLTLSLLHGRNAERNVARPRMRSNTCAVVVLLVVILPHALSQNAADAMLAGRWKLDRAASHFIGIKVNIQHQPHRYRFNLGGTTITVGDDGRDYPTAPTRTTSFEQTGKHNWLRVHKLNGRTLDSSVFTMAIDEQSFLIRTLAVDDAGVKHVSEETFLREGTGHGIEGTWRSTKGGVNTAESIDIDWEHDHRLRFDFPGQQMFFVTPLDGSSVSYGGAHAVPSVQISVSKSAPLTLNWNDLLNGKPYMQGQYIFSRSGHRLTVSSWHVTSPHDKDLAVYNRQ